MVTIFEKTIAAVRLGETLTRIGLVSGLREQAAMRNWIKVGGILVMMGLAGCGKQDPQSALDEAAQRLEDAISARQTGKAMELLHSDFQGAYGMDRQQARQRLTGTFLRYQKIGLLVVGRECWLDKGFYDRGHCTARVGVTGAQGLIPERAELYRVQTLWQQQGKDWLLREISWE